MNIWKKFLSLFEKREKEEKGCCDTYSCKHSLHIGINDYPGTGSDLRGCVNDANGWKSLMEEVYGYKTSTLLNNKATYRNVVREMNKIIGAAEAGSHVVITYSGHGTNVRDISGDEADKRDEAICLFDKLLIDDQLRTIFDKVPEGARLTFISDSCHSGTVTRAFLNTLYDEDAPRPRYLPPEDEAEVATINPNSAMKKVFSTEESMNEILITGCNSREYSYDARIGNPKMFQGAMSFFALKALRANPEITYAEFHKKLRGSLPSRHYPQTPQLEGKKENLKRKMFS